MNIIKAIEILNFRSIVKLEALTPNDLNIIVGKNDIGKSNFLKALNLFFNGETEIGVPFRFQDDFAKHAKVPNKKAPEITIRITFSTPEHFTNNDPMVWTKSWRKEGEFANEIYQSGEPAQLKGGGYKWVRRIQYKYVPAIRGAEYFDYLMGQLHDALSEINPSAFDKISSEFTKGLKAEVDALVGSISNKLGYTSQIGMPSNFRQLFATLDFSLDQNGVMISLNKRGDGIKAQHIPIILKFIADHYKTLDARIGIPETIWGFEEPENNMEMGNAFKLSRIFQIFSEDLQIFINTHSPAFYSIAKEFPDSTNLYSVTDSNGTQIQKADVGKISDFDTEMGLLPIISDYVKREVKKQEDLQKEIVELNKLKSRIKYLVLTEDNDKSFVETILEAQGYDMKFTEVVSYEGRDNIFAAIQSCKINLVNKPDLTDIIIHRDRDIYDGDEPDAQKVKDKILALEKAKGCRVHLFITDGYDAESYFINANHISELYPGIQVKDIQLLIQEATDETEDKSMDKLYEKKVVMRKGEVNFSESKAIKQLQKMYESNKDRYRYGKTVYGVLIAKLSKGRSRADLNKVTKYIDVPELRRILNLSKGKK